MKKLLIIICLLSCVSVNAQSDSTITDSTNGIGSFEFSRGGLTDYVVGTFDTSLKADFLHKAATNWIKETYKMPDKVIQASIDASMIRINGVKFGGIQANGIIKPFYDLRYTISIDFKDGKLKFDPIKLEVYVTASEYVVGGWRDFDISDFSRFYKTNRKGTDSLLVKKALFYPANLENLFNGLSKSLYDYILNASLPVSESKKDDW